MTDQQFHCGLFRWALSGGASALALGGFFWYGVSLGVATTRLGWVVWGLSTAFQLGMTAAILWAAGRRRRASGFTSADLWGGDERRRAQTRRTLRAIWLIVLGQAMLTTLVVWWSMRAGAVNRVFPLIGLIVSLHFFPLARLFSVRVYYVTALVGSLMSLTAFAFVRGGKAHPFTAYGIGMAAVMWLSAGYIIMNADRITNRAIRDRSAV